MDFGLSEPQSLMRRSIADFLKQEVPLEKVRTIMESETGHDRSVFEGLADQGVTGLLIPEEYGGLGLGLLDASCAAQELGRAATPITFHTACVLTPQLVEAVGSEDQKRQTLEAIASGKALITPILQGASNDLVATGDKISGTALWVPDGLVADAFLIQIGNKLAIIPADAQGITLVGLENVDDTRRLAEVSFQNVDATSSWLDGTLSDEALERALGATQIAIAADTLGACQNSLVIAVDYAMKREQFNRIIASFQAVKHMCAEIAAVMEPMQSLLWYSAFQWDERDAEARWLAPLLKAQAGEIGHEVVTKATQVFGGIGFTWECDMHLFFKRAGYNRQVFGSPESQRAKAARIQFN